MQRETQEHRTSMSRSTAIRGGICGAARTRRTPGDRQCEPYEAQTDRTESKSQWHTVSQVPLQQCNQRDARQHHRERRVEPSVDAEETRERWQRDKKERERNAVNDAQC